jgi:hypothetical protein
MSKYNFRPSNVPNYGLGVDFGSMDTKGTLYGQNPTGLATGKYAFTSNPDYIKASPEVQKLIAEKELGIGNSSFFEMIKSIKPTLADKEADLRIAGDFQARQQAAAAPYNMLYKGLDTLSKLPEQISANAANRAMLTVLGAKSVTDAGNAAMANSPFGKGSFVSQVPLSQQRYFS